MEEKYEDSINQMKIAINRKQDSLTLLEKLKIQRLLNPAKSTFIIFHKYSLFKMIVDFIVNSKVNYF